MKTAFLALMLATASGASARIGENRAECDARYGTPIVKLKEERSIVYWKNGMQITCHFGPLNTVDGIIFQKKAAPQDLFGKAPDDDETDLLLRANSGDYPWETVPLQTLDKGWKAKGGDMLAVRNVVDQMLVIFTKSAAASFGAEKIAKLKGF